MRHDEYSTKQNEVLRIICRIIPVEPKIPFPINTMIYLTIVPLVSCSSEDLSIVSAESYHWDS